MKNQHQTLLVLLASFLLSAGASTAQLTSINEEWDEQGCSQHNQEHVATKLDGSGNLIYTTNKANQNGSSIYLSCRHANGNTVWETALNSVGDDYGTDIVLSSNGEIFVTGAKSNGSDMDFYVAKYSASGVLIWETIFDGNNKDDVPASLSVDSNNDVYLTGTSRISNLNTNIVTIKYDGQTGVIDWQQDFDYGNKLDVGTINEVYNGSLFVTGSYVGNANTTGIVVVKYDLVNGTQSASTFFNVSQKLHLPTSMKIASNGDVFILSTSTNINQTNRNIEILALDNSLNTLWHEVIDYAGKDDEGRAIVIASDGNPVVTGYCTKPSNESFSYTAKMDKQNGGLIWSDQRESIAQSGSAKGSDLKIDGQGNIIVTGEVFAEGSKDFLTYGLDNNGELKWQRRFKGLNSDDKPLKLDVQNDYIYVTGKFMNGTENKVQTVKYRVSERSMTPVVLNGVNSHVQNEIIVRFDEDAVIPATINKIGLNFGTLNDFVKPQVIAEMQSVYPNIQWSKMTTYKIFKRMTMADSISIARDGSEIRTQPFWAILLINVDAEDEVVVCNALNANQALFPDIKYAHTNGLMTLDNDPIYPQQHSLFSTTYPDAHINVEQAWNYEIGQSHVKVGVYDTGLKWDHEDMGGEQYGNCGTCKVKGGWDYQIDDDLFFTDNNGDTDDFPLSIDNGHGTKVAGIIGGLRNNNVGIKGIAGGNYPYTNPAVGDPENILQPGESIGVSMYGFRAVTIGLSLAEVSEAMIEGSESTQNFGYGLHVMNNSWRRTAQYDDETPVVGAQSLMRDCQREIFKNQTVNVCSRGNSVGTNNHFPAYAEREFWVLNVGGSGIDGNRHTNSGWSGDVDVIAPHDQMMVQTTHNLSTSDYGVFSGTSSAAPHVAGVAGLMLSHINNQPTTPNNLSPDDVEFLIQRYADDRDQSDDPNYTVGYDEFTGHGLLDAGAVMEKIDRTQYIVKHYTAEYVVDPIPVGESIETWFNFGTYDLPYSAYYGEIFTIPFSIPNNLNPGDVILDYWPLNSKSNLLDELVQPPFPNPYSVTNETGCYIHDMTNLEGDVRGTIVHLLQDSQGNPIDIWHPVGPGDIATVGYSLHIQSQYAGIDEQDEDILNLGCFPNPTDNNVNLSFVMRESGNIDITIVDINGRVVYDAKQLYFSLGQQSFEIESVDWTSGMYFIHVGTNAGEKAIKFIKR